MKTSKLVIGIISIVLFFLVAFQSCAAGISNTLSGSNELSGSAGMLVSFLLLTAGIVGICTRNSKGGGIAAGCLYGFAGIIGITNYGSYSDLAIWSVICFIFSAVFIFGSVSIKKRRVCKNCGSELDDNDVTCPKCGNFVGEKSKHVVLYSILGILAFIIVFNMLINGNNKNEENTYVTAKLVETQKETTNQQTKEFTVGDSVVLNDITVTLKSITESAGGMFLSPKEGNIFILCEFDIENGSKKDIAVSSLLSFETYVDEYTTNISLSAIGASDKGQLDGTVAAGKKMNGTIGYEASKNWKEIEIRFTPNFWAGQDIIFTYSK